ncbi:MAG: transglutaminase [Candidatus Eisenbacteria sp.]|nr:transglutaminase [Candidatus Eisenbacteria bacterium]
MRSTDRVRGVRRVSGIAIILALACTLSFAAARASGDPATSDLILRSLPLPTEAPGDLAWDGEALWVADWEAGQLFRIDPETGAVLRRLSAPCYRPRGLAWGEGRLYVVDDLEGLIYVLDPETEVTITAYRAPNHTGLGLAWDGDALWLADDGKDSIQRLIPGDGTALTYYPSPHREPGGMAFDGTYLWVAQRRQDRIYMLDPESGMVITSFDSPGPYPCGIAPAPEGRLWVADFEEGLAYLCAPREASTYQTSDWRETEIRMTYRIENHGPGTLLNAQVHFAVPESESENQVLLAPPTFTPEQPVLTCDRWAQGIASFRRNTVAPGERFEVGYSVRARIAAVNYIIFPERVGRLSEIPQDIREAYTADGERFQVSSKLIQDTAAQIVKDEENPYWIARKIYNWVIDTLEYERVGGWDVPETLIKRGTGSCSEYAFLFIGLCRAAALPARYEAGTSLRGDDASVDLVHHRWAEVYLPGYGWIPMDPSGGDRSTPGGQADAIGRLPNRYFITTHNGGGSKALSWTYNVHATYSMRGRCAVTEDEWVIWRRAKEEGEAIIPSGARVKP